jgi:transposase
MRNYNIKYTVRLSVEERSALEGVVHRGKVAAAKRCRAHILLKADAGPEGPSLTDEQLATALDVSVKTIQRVRKAYVEEGLSQAIESRRGTRERLPKLDGEQEAQLVALVCGPAPEGRARWTLRLLADKLVELEIVDSISVSCVHQTLKKTCSSRG